MMTNMITMLLFVMMVGKKGYDDGKNDDERENDDDDNNDTDDNHDFDVAVGYGGWRRRF